MAKSRKSRRKVTPGRVLLPYAREYKGHWVYILQVDGDLFMYLAVVEGQVYFSYVEGEGKRGGKLREKDVAAYVSIAKAAAEATVDTVTGQVTDRQKNIEEALLQAGKSAGWDTDEVVEGEIVE